MTRTRIPRFAPPLSVALRLAARPALAYLVFALGGFIALAIAVLSEGRDPEALLMLALIFFIGFAGIASGMFAAILRLRTLPIFLAGGVIVIAGTWLLSMASPPKELIVAIVVFVWAFPCGMLALQHRWELFASFLPAVGWIGAVFVILNREGRIAQWEEEKASAWLPLPLFFLACFLVLWLFFLSAKQAVRVELWESLSGAAERRVAKKPSVTALPRKNIVPLLVIAAALFAIVAVLSPYLWRTGKGETGSQSTTNESSEPERRQTPRLDGDAILEQMKRLAEAAKHAAANLWPLLFLVLLYRPAKRAVLETHLLTPVVPTPPTERIDNGWEYIRIAAEDAGVVPHASDSVEELLQRIRDKGLAGPALTKAADIYARTRYGFVVVPGDAIAMRGSAIEARRELTANLGIGARIRNWWRPLS